MGAGASQAHGRKRVLAPLRRGGKREPQLELCLLAVISQCFNAGGPQASSVFLQASQNL